MVNVNDTAAHVLIVSDDLDLARVWVYLLDQHGLRASLLELGMEALEHWADTTPDMIIIDNRTWQMENIEFCRKLRDETVGPILMFISQNDESLLLDAYEAGVDECVPQPVSPRLFMVKIQAWLRRIKMVPSTLLEDRQAGDFCLDENRRLLFLPDGTPMRLTHLEARLLYLLMNTPNEVLETPGLVQRIWGFYGQGDEALLKNLVYRLRRKIEPNPTQPRYLLTEGGMGYRFQPF